MFHNHRCNRWFRYKIDCPYAQVPELHDEVGDEQRIREDEDQELEAQAKVKVPVLAKKKTPLKAKEEKTFTDPREQEFDDLVWAVSTEQQAALAAEFVTPIGVPIWDAFSDFPPGPAKIQAEKVLTPLFSGSGLPPGPAGNGMAAVVKQQLSLPAAGLYSPAGSVAAAMSSVAIEVGATAWADLGSDVAGPGLYAAVEDLTAKAVAKSAPVLPDASAWWKSPAVLIPAAVGVAALAFFGRLGTPGMVPPTPQITGSYNPSPPSGGGGGFIFNWDDELAQITGKKAMSTAVP